MAFILNPTRKFTVGYEDEETKETFEADFEFVLTEECFTDEVRQKSKNLEPILESDSDEVKEDKMFKAQGVVWHKIRKSLKAVRGITDENGNPLEVNEDTQAVIFDFIVKFGDVSVQVLTAFMGLSSKNLNAGAMK